jgi:hypothetical protein
MAARSDCACMRKPLSAVIGLMLLFAGLGSSAVLTRAFAEQKSLSAIQQEKRLGPKPTPRWYWRWQAWRLGEGYAKGQPREPNLRPIHAPQRIPAWAWRRLHFFLLVRVDRSLAVERQRHEPSKTKSATTRTTTTTTSTTTTTRSATTTATAPTTTTSSGSAPSPSFVGDFESGVASWTSTGGGPQCSNYGTPSGGGGRYRGTLAFDTTNPGQGATSGRIDLAAQSTYPLEACGIVNGPYPNVVGDDQYLGLMLRVPVGFSVGGFGDVIAEYHFVGVLSAPIELVAWGNRLELSLLTGACTSTGCAYRNGTGYPAKPVIPTGVFTGGVWWETIVHVHWATDSTGTIQAWYRQKGASSWTPTASWSGIPTEQWAAGQAVPSKYVDIACSYTSKLTSPLTIWLDNQTTGPSFSSVAATMP